MLQRFLRLGRQYQRSRAAAAYAERRQISGLEFNRYGRALGRRLLLRGWRTGLDYLLTPVNCVRYFEFDFAARCLPPAPAKCLDLSSPRLFSFFVAERFRQASIVMMNPDRADLEQTRRIVGKLRLSNITLHDHRVEGLEGRAPAFDCIWSISVLEHISGEGGDTRGLHCLYQALQPGGTLIVTVPVDRAFREEYRESDCYGTQLRRTDKNYFFQNVYDRESLDRRLFDPLGLKPEKLRWLGEVSPGHYANFEKRWLAQGRDCLIDDPREFADHYAEYRAWEEMPGFGICGFVLKKPA